MRQEPSRARRFSVCWRHLDLRCFSMQALLFAGNGRCPSFWRQPQRSPQRSSRNLLHEIRASEFQRVGFGHARDVRSRACAARTYDRACFSVRPAWYDIDATRALFRRGANADFDGRERSALRAAGHAPDYRHRYTVARGFTPVATILDRGREQVCGDYRQSAPERWEPTPAICPSAPLRSRCPLRAGSLREPRCERRLRNALPDEPRGLRLRS